MALGVAGSHPCRAEAGGLSPPAGSGQAPCCPASSLSVAPVAPGSGAGWRPWLGARVRWAGQPGGVLSPLPLCGRGRVGGVTLLHTRGWRCRVAGAQTLGRAGAGAGAVAALGLRA